MNRKTSIKRQRNDNYRYNDHSGNWERLCPHCGQYKELTEANWYRQPAYEEFVVNHGKCRQCENLARSERRRAAKAKARQA